MEGVPGNFQATGADENVSSVRQHGGETGSVGEEERRVSSEEGGQLDPLHSGRYNSELTRFFRYFSLCLFPWAAREAVRESVRKSGETSLIELIITVEGKRCTFQLIQQHDAPRS